MAGLPRLHGERGCGGIDSATIAVSASGMCASQATAEADEKAAPNMTSWEKEILAARGGRDSQPRLSPARVHLEPEHGQSPHGQLLQKDRRIQCGPSSRIKQPRKAGI